MDADTTPDVGAAPDADGDLDTGTDGDVAASPQACTREFLKTTIDQYFDALATHDPSALPLADTVRFTENTAETTVGEGLVWQSAGEVKFTRSLLDTERCGTVTEAVFPNDGVDTIFGLRLQIAAGEITEIESIVVDPETGFFATPSGILNSTGNDWETLVPPEQRSTREELEAAGAAYFASFADDSVEPPYGMPCDRLENGFKTTRGDCGNLGGAGGLRHPPQRYPVSDIEAGITAGFVLFGGGQIDFHMFKLVNHEIQFIDAVVGPRARTSGWD